MRSEQSVLNTQKRLIKELDEVKATLILDLNRAKIDINNLRKQISLEAQLEMINWFLSDEDSIQMTPKLEKRLFNLTKLINSSKEDIFRKD